MKKGNYLAIFIIIVVILAVIFSYIGKERDSSGTSNIGESDCNFEKYNEENYLSERHANSNLDKSTGGFVTPGYKGYSEVRFSKFGVVATTDNVEDFVFFLNGVECGPLVRNKGRFLHDFTNTCLGALQEGMNSFNTSFDVSGKDTLGSALVESILIEMDIKPANCDK